MIFVMLQRLSETKNFSPKNNCQKLGKRYFAFYCVAVKGKSQVRYRDLKTGRFIKKP